MSSKVLMGQAVLLSGAPLITMAMQGDLPLPIRLSLTAAVLAGAARTVFELRCPRVLKAQDGAGTFDAAAARRQVLDALAAVTSGEANRLKGRTVQKIEQVASAMDQYSTVRGLQDDPPTAEGLLRIAGEWEVSEEAWEKVRPYLSGATETVFPKSRKAVAALAGASLVVLAGLWIVVLWGIWVL